MLSWKCCRHVATCRHDTTVSLQFWPDGSVHKTEDVVAVCVGLSRHLPDFPKCVCRNILWCGSTYAQIPNAHFCHVLVLSCSGGVTTHTHNPHNTDKNREHTIHTMNSAPQHHPPLPPTKAMGAIPQNRRGHPTATP